MKTLLVAVLVALVWTTHAAVYYMVQDEVPGHENECYDENDGTFYKARERMSNVPGVCARVTCVGRREPNTVVVEKATCGVVMAPPGCQIIEDLSKPYPECCPRIVQCRETAENYTLAE